MARRECSIDDYAPHRLIYDTQSRLSSLNTAQCSAGFLRSPRAPRYLNFGINLISRASVRLLAYIQRLNMFAVRFQAAIDFAMPSLRVAAGKYIYFLYY